MDTADSFDIFETIDGARTASLGWQLITLPFV